MSVQCDWTCDGCGAVEEDAGTNGPLDWDLLGPVDLCPDCQETTDNQGQDAATGGQGDG